MIELTHLIAVLISLTAALLNALQSLFIRIGTDKGKTTDAVFVTMMINIIVLTPTVLIIYYPTYNLTSVSWVAFIAAGTLGTLLGRISFYSGIEMIGASRTTPIVAANALVATILGVLLLDESVDLIHGFAILLIISGVTIIALQTRQENPDDLPSRKLLIGIAFPFMAALAYGWEPIFANLGFSEGTPAPVGLVIKTICASLGFTLYLRWRNSIPDFSALRSANMRWFILAGISNTVFLVGYYVALSIAPVSIVMPIFVSNILFVILLSAIFMPERLEQVTWVLVVAAVMVIVGILLITIYGN